MKKYIRSIVAVLILCLSIAGITMAESNIVDSMDFQGDYISLSLEEALEVMLKDNPTLEQSQLDLEEAEVNNDKNKKTVKALKKVNAREDENSVKYMKEVSLIELPINYEIENAKRNHEATIENLKAEVEEAYFSLLQAEQLEEINKSNLNISKDLHEKTKKKFDLGLIAKQEVINSELSLINAENEYKTAQDNTKRAKMMLNTKLGYDLMTNIKLEDELEYKEFELESIAGAIEGALTNRNEIKAAEYSYEIERINMAITEKKYADTISLYKQQKVKFEKAKRSLDDTKKNIEMEVRSNYLDVLQKQEEIKAGEKSVELAQEALRLSQLSFDVGMSVLTDVEKAQTALLQAKLGLSKSILDYNLAVLKFEDSISVGRTTMPGASLGGF